MLMAAKQVVDAMYASNNDEVDSYAHQQQASCRFTECIQLPPGSSPPDPAHFVGLSTRLLFAAAIRAHTDARARERARKEAEKKARREAEARERARKEAEEKARQEAEAKARQEALMYASATEQSREEKEASLTKGKGEGEG